MFGLDGIVDGLWVVVSKGRFRREFVVNIVSVGLFGKVVSMIVIVVSEV